MGFLAKFFAPPPVAQLKSGGNAEALLKALRDPDAGGRREAADALRELPRAVRAVPEYQGYKLLSSAAERDADPGVREAAVRALVALLVDAIQESRIEAQKVSDVGLLAEWPHADSNEAALRPLDDPAGAVRAAALDVLKANGIPGGIEQVARLLSDGDWEVRAAAARALSGRAEAAGRLAPPVIRRGSWPAAATRRPSGSVRSAHG